MGFRSAGHTIHERGITSDKRGKQMDTAFTPSIWTDRPGQTVEIQVIRRIQSTPFAAHP